MPRSTDSRRRRSDSDCSARPGAPEAAKRHADRRSDAPTQRGEMSEVSVPRVGQMSMKGSRGRLEARTFECGSVGCDHSPGGVHEGLDGSGGLTG